MVRAAAVIIARQGILFIVKGFSLFKYTGFLSFLQVSHLCPDAQAVVGRLYEGADAALFAQFSELLAELLMAGEGVGEVSEPGLLCTYSVCKFKGFVQGEMGMVRFVANSVQCEMLKAVQFLELRCGKTAHVRYICDVSESKSQDGHCVVVSAYGNHVGILMRGSCNLVRGWEEGAVCLAVEVADVVDPLQLSGVSYRIYPEGLFVYEMDMPLWGSGILVLCEGICVVVAESIQDFLFAVYLRCLAVCLVEGAYVVKAARVILVVVGKEDCVKMAHSGPQHLRPEIRAGVYQYRQPVHSYEGA